MSVEIYRTCVYNMLVFNLVASISQKLYDITVSNCYSLLYSVMIINTILKMRTSLVVTRSTEKANQQLSPHSECCFSRKKTTVVFLSSTEIVDVLQNTLRLHVLYTPRFMH